MEDITPKGKISKKEGLKSARDASIASLAILIPQLLEMASTVDFWEYGMIVSMVLAVVWPAINRMFNIYRV